MLYRMTLDERFLAFLDSKDPNERYAWNDAQECACGQFCRYVYGQEPKGTAVSVEKWGDMTRGEQQRIWASPGSYNELAFAYGREDQWTFGKLRDRLFAAQKSAIWPSWTAPTRA